MTGPLWVFFNYPEISKNGNPLFFPVFSVVEYAISKIPSCLKCLFQSEAKREAADMETTFYYVIQIKLIFTTKVLHLA